MLEISRRSLVKLLSSGRLRLEMACFLFFLLLISLFIPFSKECVIIILFTQPSKTRNFISVYFIIYEITRLEETGSARVLGYTVYRGFLNRVYGILQLKYGYSVYHFL